MFIKMKGIKRVFPLGVESITVLRRIEIFFFPLAEIYFFFSPSRFPCKIHHTREPVVDNCHFPVHLCPAAGKRIDSALMRF